MHLQYVAQQYRVTNITIWSALKCVYLPLHNEFY